jgi:hypothetical protein
MGRPRATSSNREFALAFANYVTAFSDNQFDWVARKGRQSIFELLKNLAPKVHSCESYGIGWCGINKTQMCFTVSAITRRLETGQVQTNIAASRFLNLTSCAGVEFLAHN